MRHLEIIIVLLSQLYSIQAFTQSSQHKACINNTNLRETKLDRDDAFDRRTLLTKVCIASFPFLTKINQPAFASGGATAGGAYLLSAKQRYNARVSSAVTAYIELSSSLESGSLQETKDYFSIEDTGGWRDVSAAGYLLANAFRRSSTTPPDSLPSVKKWKAFAAELESLQKALKKKDLKKVKESYDRSKPLLGEYLEAVELAQLLN